MARLGHVGRPQGGFLLRRGVGGETRRRVNGVGDAGQPGRRPGIGRGQRFEDFGEQAGQLTHHADRLRPLTGEQHRELAGRGASAESRAVGRRERRSALRQFRLRAAEELRQIGRLDVRGEQQPGRRGGVELRAARLGGAGKRRPRRGDVRRAAALTSSRLPDRARISTRPSQSGSVFAGRYSSRTA